MSDWNKTIQDMYKHGIGVMQDGKHVPHDQVFKSAELLAAEAKVKELDEMEIDVGPASGEDISGRGVAKFTVGYLRRAKATLASLT